MWVLLLSDTSHLHSSQAVCLLDPIRSQANSNSAVVGFVRSYGKWLPEEGITFNAACPNVVRTNISVPAFYDKLESEGLLTPLESVPAVFEHLLGSNSESGICYETGPNFKSEGAVQTKGPPFLDDESAAVFDRLYARGKPLHLPK